MALKFPTDEKRNFRKNLVKRHKLVGYLDEWLANEPAGFEFKYEVKGEDDAFHPSGDCLPSLKELYYKATQPKVPKEWGTAMQKTFAVGHFWHQLLQYGTLQLGLAKPDAIEQRGMYGWGELVPAGLSERPMIGHWKPYHWCSGAGDIAPLELPRHGQYLVDFKTMHDFDFKTEGVPKHVADKYEAQINIYMSLFDLEKALIVPVQKGTPHDFKEFEYVRNQPLIDAIFFKWEVVSELLDEGVEHKELELDMLSKELTLNGLFLGPIAQ